MTWSTDLRRQALELKNRDRLSYGEVAKYFGVSISSLARWTSRLEPKLVRNSRATKINADELRQDVAAYPDAYHYERARRLKVSRSGIGKALKLLGISYKKNSSAS